MTDNMPPRPKPDTHCFDDDTGKDVWSHSPEQMHAYARAAIAQQIEADNLKESEAFEAFDAAVESARLLGAADAKHGFGCFTEQDARFVSAMYKSIAKARSAIAQPSGVPAGYALVPVEPTGEILRAMSSSRARDAEGEFPSLFDLIDYSGKNKTRTVMHAAYRALIAASHQPQPVAQPSFEETKD